jgi:hypothetical protein
MRSILLGILCAVIVPVAGPAAVTYSVYQPGYPSSLGFVNPINIDFTEPSLITTSTLIQPGEVNYSSGVTVAGFNSALMYLEIDPGLGDFGIPKLYLTFGWYGQPDFFVGVCFVPTPNGCTVPRGATPFDHFGTYTSGTPVGDFGAGTPPVTLTIAPASVPEPRFESALGFALLILIGMIRSARFYRST